MEDSFYTAHIQQDIADLIPGYLANRHKEAAQLGEMLASEDFDGIDTLAHRMVGVGTPYGFAYVTDLAKNIRGAARSKDSQLLSSLIEEYKNYLRVVRIVIK